MKKGISEATIGILIILSLVAIMWYYTKIYTPSCFIDPYNPNCTCPEGYKKVYVPWLGKDRWTCENESALVLDPDSPTFEQDAVEFAKNYLSTYCGDVCGKITCGDMSPCVQGLPPEGKDYCIEATYGYSEDGKRKALIKCMKVTKRDNYGRVLSSIDIWSMNFYVESETGEPVTSDYIKSLNYCYNEQTQKKCTLPEVCEYYGNPDWCIGKLPLRIISQ